MRNGMPSGSLRDPGAICLAVGDLMRRRGAAFPDPDRSEKRAAAGVGAPSNGYQRFLPSITLTGAVAASKPWNRRALAPILRVLPSQLPSGWNAGLSV